MAIAPTMDIYRPSSINTTTALIYGRVIDDGGGTITEQGVCWIVGSATPPTTANSKATATGPTTPTGMYPVAVTGLTSGGNPLWVSSICH